MTREEAINKLTSASTHERLKAARALARVAIVGDVPALRQARHTESVSYVRASLDNAIKRLSNLPTVAAPDPTDEVRVPDEVRRQIETRAREWIAGLLLHEIAAPIGLVRRAASKEILDYETSRTKRHLDSVETIFRAIEQLKTATAVPMPQEFDLAELISKVVNEELPEGGPASADLVGPRPLVITSDPELVRFAVSNGVRNAAEALAPSAGAEPHAVVVTWGQTDVDYWVSVLDRGGGIVGPIEAAFEIGKSTKKGHSGFGLAIARQALETLGGTVILQSVPDGGARYEARWERR